MVKIMENPIKMGGLGGKPTTFGNIYMMCIILVSLNMYSFGFYVCIYCIYLIVQFRITLEEASNHVDLCKHCRFVDAKRSK